MHRRQSCLCEAKILHENMYTFQAFKVNMQITARILSARLVIRWLSCIDRQGDWWRQNNGIMTSNEALKANNARFSNDGMS